MMSMIPWIGARRWLGSRRCPRLRCCCYAPRPALAADALRMVSAAGGGSGGERAAGSLADRGSSPRSAKPSRAAALLLQPNLEELRQTLHVAGFRGGHGLGLFVGTKLLLVVGLPVDPRWRCAWTLRRAHTCHAAGGGRGSACWRRTGCIGKRLPAVIAQLEMGMPDALDMMVICGQAGPRPGREHRACRRRDPPSHPVVAASSDATAHEMQVNADTRTALINLGKAHRARKRAPVRRGADPVHADGTPLTQALRTLSAEQRQEMLAKFEGQAATPAGAADAADDRLHPALRVPDRGGPAVIQVVGVLNKMLSW